MKTTNELSITSLKSYRNLRRVKMTDEELLMEMIPYAEGIFDPIDVTIQTIVIPEMSVTGSSAPIMIHMIQNDVEIEEFNQAIGDCLKIVQEKAPRVCLVMECWYLDVNTLPFGMAISDHPEKKEGYLMTMYRTGKKPLLVWWTITNKDGVRALGEPEVVISAYDRYSSN